MKEIGIGAVVKDDPLADLSSNASLRFNPLLITHEAKSPAEVLPGVNFGGILLSFCFVDSDVVNINGSGVIIGSGIALCAKHVIEDNRRNHVEKMANFERDFLAIGWDTNSIHIWHVTRITFIEKSDLALLSLRYASDLPPNNIFNVASISTRLPLLGENLWIVGFKAA